MDGDLAADRGEPVTAERALASDDAQVRDDVPMTDERAARVLVEHLYARGVGDIPHIEVAQLYRAGADGARVGGDLVDVYHYDNGATSFAVADISGRGIDAAIHAALVKFGMRAYASHGLTAEETIRALNALYIENSMLEDVESFVSVFFGIVDPERCVLNYASAGHEPVVLFNPGETPQVLPPTGPIIGVDTDRRQFRQRFVQLHAGAVLAAFTDGVTEARSPEGHLLGMDYAVRYLEQWLHAPAAIQGRRLLEEAQRFCAGVAHDDIAILIARFKAVTSP